MRNLPPLKMRFSSESSDFRFGSPPPLRTAQSIAKKADDPVCFRNSVGGLALFAQQNASGGNTGARVIADYNATLTSDTVVK
jgi:hypothetical protein